MRVDREDDVRTDGLAGRGGFELPSIDWESFIGVKLFSWIAGIALALAGGAYMQACKQPLAARGHVGHEKVANDEWLTRNRIHLIFSQAPPPVSGSGPIRVDEIAFGDVLKARIWIYEDAIMDRLRSDPRVKFTPIEDTLRAIDEALLLVAVT